MKDLSLLKRLYEIHSPSYGERRIKRFIKRWVQQNVPNVTMKSKDKNLYFTKGDSESYPCVVAHLDQVQKIHSSDFQAVETEDIIFGYSKANRQLEGLGADDKNGIWIALMCLEKYDAIKVAFFYGEEIGCVGSERADMTFFDNCRFVVEPDRRGYGDLITTISYTELCSEAFVKAIEPHLWGYKEEHGMMTDVETLKTNGLKVSCINLSCGYYNPHSDEEYTVKEDLLNCLDFVEHIIETVTWVDKHEDLCGYSRYNYYGCGYGKYGKYDPYDDWKDWCVRSSYTTKKTDKSEAKANLWKNYGSNVATIETEEQKKKREREEQMETDREDIDYLFQNEYFSDFNDFYDEYASFFPEWTRDALELYTKKFFQ